MNVFSQIIVYFLLIILRMNHPVHVSIINLDYDKDKQQIDIAVKVYKDDLNLLFVHLYQRELDYENNIQLEKEMDVINSYIANHFQLSSYKLDYENYKVIDEFFWIYYDIKLEDTIDSLDIMNSIFLDLYFDQKNMLICNYNNQQKGYLFNLKQTKHTINFNEF